MYLLINLDQSINFADEHPIKKGLNFDGLKLIEFPEKKLKEVIENIQLGSALWDETRQKVILDPLLVREHTHG